MIKVENLTKTFIKYEKEKGLMGMLKAFFNAKKVEKIAVNHINFEIQPGEIVGYIGANGAGKSTTIKMLSGILTPTEGTVSVFGLDPKKDRIAHAYNIGVVFGQRTQLWWDLPLTETYTILKEIYNVSDEDYKKRMEFFNEVLNIDDFIKSPVRTLSLGQRMRADIAASLLHNPRVLFLDEPTVGLDVVAKQKMREAIKLMNKTFNTTVILTTHDLDDIEELCKRIIIIDEGKLIYDGSLTKIKKEYGFMKNVIFEMKDAFFEDINLNEVFKLKPDELKQEKNVNKLNITFDKRKITVSEITDLIMKKYAVIDIEINETHIEDIVRNIYEHGLNHD
ncbi:MAG: ATP-binding cassette domain-containing protein [Acholeplasmataceae bacterium]|nr:ATP-binding cassette domain-containing protein [Acholeplasmataceae bacterium]